MPELVRALRLKAHRRDRADHPRIVETGSTQDAIDGWTFEQSCRRSNQAFRCLDAVLLEQQDGPRRREMAPLLFEVLISSAAMIST
jgi:hypothetical protein